MPRRAEPSRRGALRQLLGGTALLLASGHAPYGQWGVYRKRHLLILTTRADPPSHELGERLAALLAEKLPESRAQPARAPNLERVASLLSTGQMDLALMRHEEAAALRLGAAPFAGYGPAPLRTVVGPGDFLLVCREDFSPRHAFLIAEALSQSRDALPTGAAASLEAADARVPLHPGSQAYFEGGPMPEHPSDDDHEHAPDLDARR